MDAATAWQQMFENWPEGLPRQGIIATTFQENIGFVNFMTADGLLAVERDRPDTLNARKVVISYAAISAVKTTDTDAFSGMAQLGFQE